MLRRRIPFACHCLALTLLASPAVADQVELANGDRLTGTVLRKEGDQLVLQTPYAGEIKINWSQVVRVQTDEPMSLVLSNQSLAESRSIGPAERKPAPPRPTDDATPRSDEPAAAPDTSPPIPLEQVAYINAGPGIDVLGVRWKGRINVGGSGNRGNSDTDNLHVDGEAVARRQENRYTISGNLDRGKDRNVVTKQNARLSGKYDLFIGPTWYGYALATLEEDRFRDIDLRTTLGAGVGHQLIDDEQTSLSLEGGLNHVRTDFALAPDESYPALRWALKFDHRLFSTDLQVFHNHELLTDLQRTERTFVRSQTGLRVPLLQHLLATAQLNVDFDNMPAPGKTRTDRTYLFTLGYHW
jgi:putative salt-induced outer membrane protein YdiY